jgi:CDP-diacylglycerol pyrophosphatase
MCEMAFRGTGAAIAAVMMLALSDAAFAAPARPKSAPPASRKVQQKRCYTYISGSASPQPCDRVTSAAPTTAIPMVIIRYR